MPYFDLSRTSNDQYMFNLRADNHAVVLISERYATQQAAIQGIAAVRSNSSVDSRYTRLFASNGHPYFVLRAMNGEVIGVSELYANPWNMEDGVAFVKRWGQSAAIRDNT